MNRVPIIMAFAAVVALLLSGCDQGAELVNKSTDKMQSVQVGNGSQQAVEAQGYEQDSLMRLLDDQEFLAIEIRDAKMSGDMSRVQALFAEFEAMDANFTSELNSAQNKLSSVTIDELSRRRGDIVRMMNER